MTTFTSWDTELYHHGIKGQEHGVRRYQNEDGSLTPLGRIHYGYGQIKERRAQRKEERRKRAELKAKNRPKDISEMSDEELRTAIARKNLENEYKKASGKHSLIDIANKIGDAYEKHQDRALRREELRVEEKKAIAEAKKSESERKKAVADKAKSRNERIMALYKRRTDRKTLRKTETTADLEAALSKKYATKASYALAQSKADSLEQMLKKRKHWKKLTGADLNAIINTFQSPSGGNRNGNRN